MKEQLGEYTLDSRAGSGGYGQCYVAMKKGDNRAYILKTINPLNRTEENIKALRNEIDRLVELNDNPKNNNIPIIYYSNKDQINSKPTPYYVMDYFSRESLYYYVTNENYNLSERYVKVIFKKILLAIQYCHNKNICHFDIKPKNIVFDKDFEPIILDYGAAQKYEDKKSFNKRKGTVNYMCPEMWDDKEYDGRKADIFSLGALLFNLVTGTAGFNTSKTNDSLYKLIRGKNYKKYWEKIPFTNKELSENFKSLYISMIAYESKQRLKTIEDILESDWMKEINDLQEDEYTTLENEVRNELLILYNDIQEKNGQLNLAKKIQGMGFGTRSGNEKTNSLRYYDRAKTKPKKIPINRININRFIKINGLSDGVKFMDDLAYEIAEKFKDDCLVEPLEEDLKFILFYDDEGNGDCNIEVELYEYETGGYLLEFLRTKGEISNYYHHFLEIRKFIFEKYN